MYNHMINMVVPRPIAFVSTVSPAGRHNAAPFSYYVPLTSRPPLIGISINRRGGEPKDTLRNIQATGDFVVNVVTESLAARVVETSGDWPEDVDELSLTGLTTLPSTYVKSPRVAESPIHMECKLDRVIELGETSFVVGEILCVHMSDKVLTDGRIDVTKLKPLGRLGGDGYSVVREVVHLARPKVTRG
jgi:flavin reductase (DIM6/NTAB) family NADH-FMN oxidoreductase RutF